MPTCGNCGKQDASVAEIKECYRAGGASPEWSEVFAGLDEMDEKYPETPEPEITDGMWITPSGAIYKVQKSQKTGYLYGKILDVEPLADGQPTLSFTYQPSVPNLLRRERARKMTLDEAKSFGALYGMCCQCGRTLTNEESIEAGIGPVCRTKFAI